MRRLALWLRPRLSLANALNMRVTAEGVETEDQARLLRLAGCEKLQGYYYSKPRPYADLIADKLLICPQRRLTSERFPNKWLPLLGLRERPNKKLERVSDPTRSKWL